MTAIAAQRLDGKRSAFLLLAPSRTPLPPGIAARDQPQPIAQERAANAARIQGEEEKTKSFSESSSILFNLEKREGEHIGSRI